MYCARVLWINAGDEQRESAYVCASVIHTWDNILSRTSRDIDVTSAISVHSAFIANVGYYRVFFENRLVRGISRNYRAWKCFESRLFIGLTGNVESSPSDNFNFFPFITLFTLLMHVKLYVFAVN